MKFNNEDQDLDLEQNNLFSVGEKLSLLKTTSIHDDNVSGKNNLAQIIPFLKKFVIIVENKYK